MASKIEVPAQCKYDCSDDADYEFHHHYRFHVITLFNFHMGY